jgi:hypothetical protein
VSRIPENRKSQPPRAKRPAATATPAPRPNRAARVVIALAGTPLRTTARPSGRISQKK